MWCVDVSLRVGRCSVFVDLRLSFVYDVLVVVVCSLLLMFCFVLCVVVRCSVLFAILFVVCFVMYMLCVVRGLFIVACWSLFVFVVVCCL